MDTTENDAYADQAKEVVDSVLEGAKEMVDDVIASAFRRLETRMSEREKTCESLKQVSDTSFVFQNCVFFE